MPVSSARVFTIEEVEDLIPTLESLLDDQFALQSEIERLAKGLADQLGELPSSLEVVDSDTESVRELKHDLTDRILKYERGWRHVQELGAVVKDTHLGLLDFYGRIDGRLVWLCWRYGERQLGYYHDLDAGYAGRRALQSETRSRLLN